MRLIWLTNDYVDKFWLSLTVIYFNDHFAAENVLLNLYDWMVIDCVNAEGYLTRKECDSIFELSWWKFSRFFA